MDIITGVLCVAVVYVMLMPVFSLIIGLPVRLSMALALLGAIIVVVTNWKRLDRWSRPTPRDKKPHDKKLRAPRFRSGNRAARRSKR